MSAYPRCPESMAFHDHGTRRCVRRADESHRHWTAVPVVMGDGNTYLDIYTWEKTT